nr:hypothetical protein [uncultured Rhodoferax sp.]
MTTPTLDLFHCVFAKTIEGQQEIQTRAKKLPPLIRRLLILVDGKQTGQELSAYMTGQNVVDMLTELLAQDCISVVKSSSAPGKTLSTTGVDATSQPALSTPFLQPPETRTPKELEMARNFMINTINAEFGQHMCLTLIEAISSCSSTQELRQQYPSWHKTMSLSRSSSKVLPGLVEKLMRVI